MATYKIVVQKHQQRDDGKCPVRIRVTVERMHGWIETPYYAGPKQITVVQRRYKGKLVKSYELRDPFIIRELSSNIERYEKLELALGVKVGLYDAKELAAYLEKKDRPVEQTEIDFFAFCEGLVEKTENKGTAGLYRTVKDNLKKFVARERLNPVEISSNFLRDYEAWMKKEDKALRKKAMAPGGINLYMRTLASMFTDCKDMYNDEDKGEFMVPNNPFKRYKIPAPPETEPQALDVALIKKIRDFDYSKPSLDNKGDNHYKDGVYTGGSLTELARDLFWLSFCLAGMNSADLYNATDYKDGRLSYNRTKTKSRRKDRAFFSILVPHEVVKLMDKYKDKTGSRVFNFYQRWRDTRGFNKAINEGLKTIGASIGVPDLRFYSARYSFATIARNDCNIPKADVKEVLNHADSEMKVTDKYIKKDWGIVDKVVRKVLARVK